jgi:uncharacterized protein (TIGR02118 family)
MIRASVMYPYGPGKKFDMKYYTNQHMALVHRILDPVGLIRTEVDSGIGTTQPGAPAPFVAIGHLYVKNMEDLQQCLACMAKSPELMNDITNFTDIQPQFQISEIL